MVLRSVFTDVLGLTDHDGDRDGLRGADKGEVFVGDKAKLAIVDTVGRRAGLEVDGALEGVRLVDGVD